MTDTGVAEITELSFVGDIKKPHVYCFVCTGNTCRSPMAEAVFNSMAQGKGCIAVSRGIFANVGEPISKNAVSALELAGVASVGFNDYKRHRAKQLCRGDMAEFDEIIAISSSHAERIMMSFPEYSSKVVALSDIADPYGGDLDTYRACLAEITEKIIAEFPFLSGKSGE